MFERLVSRHRGIVLSGSNLARDEHQTHTTDRQDGREVKRGYNRLSWWKTEDDGPITEGGWGVGVVYPDQFWPTIKNISYVCEKFMARMSVTVTVLFEHFHSIPYRDRAAMPFQSAAHALTGIRHGTTSFPYIQLKSLHVFSWRTFSVMIISTHSVPVRGREHFSRILCLSP